MLLLVQAQLLVEGLSTWASAEEVFKRLHLILSTTTFKDGMSVTSAFLAVHGVLLKDSVEHVSRVDLG